MLLENNPLKQGHNDLHYLYCNMLFDRFINSVSHPQMVDKGVWRKNDAAADVEGKNMDDTVQKR